VALRAVPGPLAKLGVRLDGADPGEELVLALAPGSGAPFPSGSEPGGGAVTADQGTEQERLAAVLEACRVRSGRAAL